MKGAVDKSRSKSGSVPTAGSVIGALQSRSLTQESRRTLAYLPLCLQVVIMELRTRTHVVLGALKFLIGAESTKVKLAYVFICHFLGNNIDVAVPALAH